MALRLALVAAQLPSHARHLPGPQPLPRHVPVLDTSGITCAAIQLEAIPPVGAWDHTWVTRATSFSGKDVALLFRQYSQQVAALLPALRAPGPDPAAEQRFVQLAQHYMAVLGVLRHLNPAAVLQQAHYDVMTLQESTPMSEDLIVSRMAARSMERDAEAINQMIEIVGEYKAGVAPLQAEHVELTQQLRRALRRQELEHQRARWPAADAAAAAWGQAAGLGALAEQEDEDGPQGSHTGSNGVPVSRAPAQANGQDEAGASSGREPLRAVAASAVANRLACIEEADKLAARLQENVEGQQWHVTQLAKRFAPLMPPSTRAAFVLDFYPMAADWCGLMPRALDLVRQRISSHNQ